jgi:hypothetical protein
VRQGFRQINLKAKYVLKALGFLNRQGFLSIFEYDGDTDFAVAGVNADREVDHSGNSVRLVIKRRASNRQGGGLSGGLAQKKSPPEKFGVVVFEPAIEGVVVHHHGAEASGDGG